MTLEIETDPVTMSELGGPRDEAAIRDVHVRRLREPWWFVIADDDGTGLGTIGVWEAEHHGEVIHETGWTVRPPRAARASAPEGSLRFSTGSGPPTCSRRSTPSPASRTCHPTRPLREVRLPRPRRGGRRLRRAHASVQPLEPDSARDLAIAAIGTPSVGQQTPSTASRRPGRVSRAPSGGARISTRPTGFEPLTFGSVAGPGPATPPIFRILAQGFSGRRTLHLSSRGPRWGPCPRRTRLLLFVRGDSAAEQPSTAVRCCRADGTVRVSICRL